MLRSTIFGLVLLLLATSRVSAQENQTSETPATEMFTLAWFHVGRGPHEYQTYAFRNGRVVGRRDGLFVGVEGELVEVQLRSASAPAWDCEGTNLVGSESATRRIEVVSVVAVQADREHAFRV